MLIKDLAEKLANECDDMTDEALTAVTTYAAQLGYHVFEGGQSPMTELKDDDAETIREVYANNPL